MTEWTALVNKVRNLSKKTKIALVGKYVELQDAYISVVEALRHAGYSFDTDVEVKWVNAEHVTAENVKRISWRYRWYPCARWLRRSWCRKVKSLRFNMLVKTKFHS